MPDGVPPPWKKLQPELMVPPSVVMEIWLEAALVAILLELIPVPPELMMSPAPVVIEMFPKLAMLPWIAAMP